MVNNKTFIVKLRATAFAWIVYVCVCVRSCGRSLVVPSPSVISIASLCIALRFCVVDWRVGLLRRVQSYQHRSIVSRCSADSVHHVRSIERAPAIRV